MRCGALCWHIKKEGFAVIAGIKPVDCLVGCQVRCIAFKAFMRAVFLDENRIIVAALPGKYFPMVKADGCGFKVPLSDDRRVVTIVM